MDSKPNIAVIGAGKWGKNLIRVFAKLGCWVGIYDPPLRLRYDYKEADGVVIATPNETHYSYAKECLLAGKDVFVEKPMTMNVKEAEELVELAERKNLILMTGHIMEYHPAIVKLRELVRNIQLINSVRMKLDKRKDDVLWVLAPHDVALILSLMGTPDEVKIERGDRYAWVGMRFGDKFADTYVSWEYPTLQQFTVLGDKRATFNSKLIIDNEEIIYPDDEPLKLECEDFIHSIETREPPRTNGKKALEVIKVLCTI